MFLYFWILDQPSALVLLISAFAGVITAMGTLLHGWGTTRTGEDFRRDLANLEARVRILEAQQSRVQ